MTVETICLIYFGGAVGAMIGLAFLCGLGVIDASLGEWTAFAVFWPMAVPATIAFLIGDRIHEARK